MNERTNITINGNVTINIESPADVTQPKNNSVPQDAADNAQTDQNEPLINHDEDNLIDNETSFFGLLDVLRNCPEAIEAEKDEVERKIEDEKEARLKSLLGEDYEDSRDEFKKADRRPGPVQLYNKYHRIAHKDMSNNAYCDVYENGYAVFDDGDRRTVVWVPDCGSITFYFTPLRENEKEYLKQKETVEEDVTGPAPWYVAVSVAGMDSITRNLEHPKSKGNSSASESDDEDVKPDYVWHCGGHVETPEEALIRKENEMERRAMLTSKQKEVYDLYNMGYTHEQIGSMLGIDRTAVTHRLKGVKKTFRENREKFF